MGKQKDVSAKQNPVVDTEGKKVNPEVEARLKKANAAFVNLAAEFDVEFVPIVQYTDRGLVAQLQIRDVKQLDKATV